MMMILMSGAVLEMVGMQADLVTKEIRKVDWDHLDFCIYHLYFQIQVTEKYSRAMC